MSTPAIQQNFFFHLFFLFPFVQTTIIIVIAIANLFYIKSLKSDIEELKREIVVKELEASQLKSKIDLQNQKIKELEVKSSDIQKEYSLVESKYSILKDKEKENVEKFSKDNNISINESTLTLEKKRIMRGLDAFFTK